MNADILLRAETVSPLKAGYLEVDRIDQNAVEQTERVVFFGRQAQPRFLLDDFGVQQDEEQLRIPVLGVGVVEAGHRFGD